MEGSGLGKKKDVFVRREKNFARASREIFRRGKEQESGKGWHREEWLTCQTLRGQRKQSGGARSEVQCTMFEV